MHAVLLLCMVNTKCHFYICSIVSECGALRDSNAILLFMVGFVCLCHSHLKWDKNYWLRILFGSLCASIAVTILIFLS